MADLAEVPAVTEETLNMEQESLVKVTAAAVQRPAQAEAVALVL
jgi:hypothetical protein